MTMQDDNDVDGLSVPDPDTGEFKGQQCTAIKVNGERCSMRARADDEEGHCLFHGPIADATRHGNIGSGRKPTLKKLKELPGELRTPDDVLRAVNALANAIAERDMTPANVSALVKLYALAIDTMSGAQAELRLSELEALAAKGDG